MSGQSWTVKSEFSKDEFLKHAENLYDTHKYVTFAWHTGKQRTHKQNNALHKYFTLLADELNNAGWDQRKTLRESIELPWSQSSVKEYLWLPVMLALHQKDSTASLDKAEINEVYEALTRHLAQRTGVFVAFPELNDL
jgi:hypothetical protein